MFKGGFGYHGNRYDVIKCLERNLDIPVISQSMIYFSNETHEIFLLNCPNACKSCKKPSRASLSYLQIWVCLVVCLVVWLCSNYITVWPRDLRTSNLVPRAFSLRKKEG